MKSEEFMEEATERYRKNLKLDMEYNRVAALRKQAKTQGWKSDYWELVGIVYLAMIVSAVIGVLIGAS